MEVVRTIDTATRRAFNIYGWDKKNVSVRGSYDDGEKEFVRNMSLGRIQDANRKQINSAHNANELVTHGANLNKARTEKSGGVYIPMIKSDFRLPIAEMNSEIQGCVFKLFYGDRYVIIKGKYLAFSLKLFNDGYNGFHNNAHNHTALSGHAHFYFRIYKYIRDHWSMYQFRVEVLFESDDPFELLCREQDELDKHRTKKKLLNSNINAYIPGWISKDIVDRYKEKYDL